MIMPPEAELFLSPAPPFAVVFDRSVKLRVGVWRRGVADYEKRIRNTAIGGRRVAGVAFEII